MRIPDRHVTMFAETANPSKPEGGGDPFGIGHLPKSETYARAIDAVALALDGMDEDTALKVAHSLHVGWANVRSFDPSHTPLDLTTARLISARGVDPLAALWFARLRTEAMPVLGDEDDDGGPFALRIDAREQVHPGGRRTPRFDGTVCRIGDDILWNQDGALRAPPLPATVAAALPGRLLLDLVGHPVLDMIGLRILEATCDGDHTVVVTDHAARAAGLGDLAAMGPRGCR